jgi:hypothetical protein
MPEKLKEQLLDSFLAGEQIPKITSNPLPPVNPINLELISKAKLAKDYYMYSPEAPGGTFEERLKNLLNNIKVLLSEYIEIRKSQYQKITFEFYGSDWATGHHADKTELISLNTYIFTSILKSQTGGDWKGGPSINGVDRRDWVNGDIEGGNVTWTTGGHGRATTWWKISAKYSILFIDRVVNQELLMLKVELNKLSIPTE